MSAAPQRLLIVKPSSFGDVIHTLPALDALSRHWPQARIDWLVKEEWADLLRGQRALSDLLLLPKNIFGWCRLAATLRRRRYDMVIDFQGLFRSGAASWLSRAPARVGFADGREGSRWFYTRPVACDGTAIHAVDRALDLLRQIGVPADGAARFPLEIPEDSENWARALLRREQIDDGDAVVVLHPAARWQTKRWPAARFARLAERLAAGGVKVFLVAGKEQKSQVDGVARLLRAPAVDLAGRCTLPELAALLKKASLAISNDSGPMHLAAALGTPVIGLFGPTDPRRVGPYGALHAALKKPFDCTGCRRDACVRNQGCLQAISVDDVLAAAAPFLPRAAAPEISVARS